MTETLKNCPFCGGTPKEKLSHGWMWIECRDCGAKGPAERFGHGGNHDGAWNKRAPGANLEVVTDDGRDC